MLDVYYLNTSLDNGLKEQYKEVDINLIPLIVDTKLILYSKDNFLKYLINKYHLDKQNINLICESIFCNIGLSLADKLPRINKLILLLDNNKESTYFNLLMHLKTKDWGNESLNSLIKKQYNILFMYYINNLDLAMIHNLTMLDNIDSCLLDSSYLEKVSLYLKR